MRETVRVAVVQLDVAWLEVAQNIQRMRTLAAQAARDGAELILFPELATVGYVTERDPAFAARYVSLAEPVPGTATDALAAVAREHGVWIAFGMCEMHPRIQHTTYNTAVLLNPAGEVVGTHRKIHIPAEEKHYFHAGRSLDVWDTELGRLGMAICYDAMFPETLRTLALKGAEVILCPFNVPRQHLPSDLLHHLTRTRAFENRVFVVSCNRVGTQPGLTFFGGSAVADPGGALLMTADDREGIYPARLERKSLVDKRAVHTVFQDRRPDLYAPITALD